MNEDAVIGHSVPPCVLVSPWWICCFVIFYKNNKICSYFHSAQIGQNNI